MDGDDVFTEPSGEQLAAHDAENLQSMLRRSRSAEVILASPKTLAFMSRYRQNSPPDAGQGGRDAYR